LGSSVRAYALIINIRLKTNAVDCSGCDEHCSLIHRVLSNIKSFIVMDLVEGKTYSELKTVSICKNWFEVLLIVLTK